MTYENNWVYTNFHLTFTFTNNDFIQSLHIQHILFECYTIVEMKEKLAQEAEIWNKTSANYEDCHVHIEKL